DQHISHRGKAVAPILLAAPTRRSIAQDGRPVQRPQPLELVGHLGVHLANVPAPQIGEQFLRRCPIQPVELAQRPSKLHLRDPTQVRVPAQAGPAQPLEELAGSKPKATLPAVVQVVIGRDLQDAADVKDHRSNRHQQFRLPEGSGARGSPVASSVLPGPASPSVWSIAYQATTVPAIGSSPWKRSPHFSITRRDAALVAMVALMIRSSPTVSKA